MTLSGGFLVLVLLLGYWQMIAAGSLNDREDNLQTAQRERLIDRGRIISADGRILAASRARRVQGQRLYQRIYPQGSLAAHAVGYATIGGEKTGLEDSYDRYLSGSFGAEPILQRLNLHEKEGANLFVTLDTRVQQAAIDGLAGQKGAVVAMDPRTGAILALASSPTYDPTEFLSDPTAILADEDAPLVDRATDGRYPPGSTFKVITATAALQSDLGITPDTRFDDTGSYKTPGGQIRNFGGEKFGEHDLKTALTNSINTTFARLGDELGADRLGEEMTLFDIGKRIPIDLPEDEVAVAGRYRDGKLLPNGEQNIDVARIAIGQEQLLMTPLQMVMVAAGIANGGTLMQPHLMSRIVDRRGSVVRREDLVELGEVASAETAAQMTDMMKNVVNDGTGTAAALSDLNVQAAGKTGTAETGNAGLNQAWFIGFAPAEDPEVAVAVVIEGTPSTGGTVAAPIAADVMSAVLRPPTDEEGTR
ncbi:MAG: penicillin-binding protein [Miltoncostaeaceae bacterium]|jgi:peptidoglycan glycosyltransferase|nr:penicillin-binding protein [Miltoncostaeaceae bacterium]